MARRVRRFGFVIGLIACTLIGFHGTRERVRAASAISGTVFQDFNGNGVRDLTSTITNDGAGAISTAVDAGVAGVVVTAYNAAGTAVGTALTVGDGTYVLNALSAGPYRIEFTGLPAGMQPGPIGPNNGTTVRFVADGNATGIDLGIGRAEDYCQNNPELVTSCYVFGDQVGGANAASPVVVSFPYSAGSDQPTHAAPWDDYSQPTTHAVMVPANQVGTTFGLAYARGTRQIYVAALMKKHAGFGPGGPGAIYRIDRDTNAVVGTFTVPDATTNVHDPADYMIDNYNVAWDAVGKTSLGGMALSADEQSLYVMNLENRTLYRLNATTGAVMASQAVPVSIALPTPGGTAEACADADERPFAVKWYRDQLYIGAVCSAESTQNMNDLHAAVWTVDPATLAFGAAPVFSMALTYPRGIVINAGTAGAEWRPWAPTVATENEFWWIYPQPILADLDFDRGNLLLGLRDRIGDQAGAYSPEDPARPDYAALGMSGGDLLRACGTLGTGWTLEGNARCGGTGELAQDTGQGPGTGPNTPPGSGMVGYGEFYHDDLTIEPGPIPITGPDPLSPHQETVLGGLAQVPGFPNLATTMYDVNPATLPGQGGDDANGGVRWNNNSTGASAKVYVVYRTPLGTADTFSKSNGLGDLLALCDRAPIEIGNRVWLDRNNNGVQDPDEPPIAGVVVRLLQGTTEIASATTDANGNYSFSSAAGTSTASAIYGANLQPNTEYQLSVALGQASLPDLEPTAPDRATGSDPDLHDSDATTSSTAAVIAVLTGPAGANDHTLDFGFTLQPPAEELDIAITQTVDVEPGSCAVQNDEVELVVTAENLGSSDGTNVVVNYALPEGLAFVAASPSVGTYDPGAGVWQIGTLAASQVATLRVTAQVAEPGSFSAVASLGGVEPADVNSANNTATAMLEGCASDVEATEIWWGYNPDHETFDFYVTVRNNGPEVTDGPITVTIPLPAGMTFAMAEAGWACELEAETNTVACTRFDLAIDPGQSIRFAVWSHGETPDAVTVAAHVTYPPDLNPGNNVITLDDCCGRVAERRATERRAAEQAPAPADIAVTQTSAVTTVDLMRHVTYTVSLWNLGPEPTPQIRLSDVLPRGATLVSATSPHGECHAGPNGRVLACTLNAVAVKERADVIITLATLHTGALTHVVSATGAVPDPAVTNNQVKETTLLAPDRALDPEGTGVPTAWRSRYGLEGDEAAAAADPDGDGLSNLEEFLRGTHPRGLFRGHFAEGATGFFQTDLGLVNPGEAATEVVLSFLTERGDQLTRAFTLGPGARTSVPLNAALAGWTTAAATLVESDHPVAADRLMTWPGQQYIHDAMAEDVLVPDYASSLETAVPAPSATWYFAEGATAGLFDLYYLLQNPADTEVTATIQYLRQGDVPVTRTYAVPAHSRRTIWVDAEPGLDNALVAATITADAPIVAERAMYFSPAGVFGVAGHAAAGVAQPAATWHFAEGATGAFFDAFLLFGNPHAEPVSVDVQYQLPTGRVVPKTYVVPAQQRLTVYVDAEGPALAETAFAATVTASAPIVAERAMWWPGPTADQWTEASATLGATTAGTRWAIAEARVGTAGRTEATPGGPTESFVLLSNASATAGQVRVRLITESGTTVEHVVEVAAHARRTLALGVEWPALAGQRASVVVESLDPAVPITVEHACYSSIPGHVWTAGAAARATPLP